MQIWHHGVPNPPTINTSSNNTSVYGRSNNIIQQEFQIEDFRDRPWYVELGLNSTPAARRRWFGRSRLDPSSIVVAKLQLY